MWAAMNERACIFVQYSQATGHFRDVNYDTLPDVQTRLLPYTRATKAGTPSHSTQIGRAFTTIVIAAGLTLRPPETS